MTATTVKCGCGWRGRRQWRLVECEHEGMCGCTLYGWCPKCGGHVNAVSDLREAVKVWAETERWMASPEGKAELARIGQATAG